MHHDVLDALNGKFRSYCLCHLFGIAIHGTVDYDYTFLSCITAQTVVDTDNLGYIVRPHRSMSGTNGRDRQSAQLCQSFLYRRTVFTYDIRIVTYHFIPILIQIHTRIQETSVERTEATEAVTGKKHPFRFIKGHHCFGPMHHRSHIETELMVS